jgi:hypothetical protein
MMTVAALLFGKALFLFTFGAATIHFTVTQVVFKIKPATGTFSCAGLGGCFTTRKRAFEDGFAVAAPVFSF